MIIDEMRQRLDLLTPSRLEILDESEQHRGHGGWHAGGETHFRIRIASPAFADLSHVARHRAIHRALGDIMSRIHALAVEILPH